MKNKVIQEHQNRAAINYSNNASDLIDIILVEKTILSLNSMQCSIALNSRFELELTELGLFSELELKTQESLNSNSKEVDPSFKLYPKLDKNC